MNGTKLDHVGLITTNIGLFERFWCDILGFQQVHESMLTPAMGSTLFNAGPALIRRYSHPEWDTDIEIHQFEHRVDEPYWRFDRPGMNHICIHTGGPGSRDKFLEQLEIFKEDYWDIPILIYDNPKGWQNIFLQDFESNFIELREDLE